VVLVSDYLAAPDYLVVFALDCLAAPDCLAVPAELSYGDCIPIRENTEFGHGPKQY
jgi:hypothetical protein